MSGYSEIQLVEAYEIVHGNDNGDRMDRDNPIIILVEGHACEDQYPRVTEARHEDGSSGAQAEVCTSTQSQPLPSMTLLTILLVTSFFLLGVVTDGDNQLKPSLSFSQPPPQQAILYFTAIGEYPSCSDIRLQLWRLWTSALVHGGLFHFIGNILVLTIYGPAYEELSAVAAASCMTSSSSSYVYLAILTIPICNIAVAYVDPYTTVVGLSGFVYALMGACLFRCLPIWFWECIDCLTGCLCCLWCCRDDTASVSLATQPTIHMQSTVRLVMLCLAFQTCWDITIYMFFEQSYISYTSHIVGFISGFILDGLFLRQKTTAIIAFVFTMLIISIFYYCSLPLSNIGGTYTNLGNIYSSSSGFTSCCEVKSIYTYQGVMWEDNMCVQSTVSGDVFIVD
jgi:membrane associated rhomboid family serine protease